MRTIRTESGRAIRPPAKEEKAAIRRGIEEDPDAREWTEEDFAKACPAKEVLPPERYAVLPRKRGRPKLENPKVFTGIRFNADVLEGLRALGKGWQTRVNDVMREWLKTHSASQ
jgi:uncharacterized protein (DUF4415 family)